jgi:ribonuclease HII
MSASEERIVAGIDEAGLGPLLGPLTLGFSAFRVPRGERTLWQRLAPVVAKRPKARDKRRIVVADSKVVFQRSPLGHQRLERTVLSFLAQVGGRGEWPADGMGLLATAPEGLAPRTEVLAQHPWYARLPQSLPVWNEADELSETVERLRRKLEKAEMRVLAAGARAIPAGELNASYAKTDNKSLTLWEKTAEIMRELWAAFGAPGLELVVDRHGGRKHYANLLAQYFPETFVEVLGEGPKWSAYTLHGDGRKMRVTFVARGEERSFAVALGSCMAKYVRETAMDAFNAYFEELQEGLRPTAGYWTDGQRWLGEAAEAVEKAGVSPQMLVRER